MMGYSKKNLSILTCQFILMFTVLSSGCSHADQKQKAFQPTAKEQKELQFYQQSEQWFTQHLKHPPIIVDGQHLNPKTQYMMEQMGDTGRLQTVLELLFKTSMGRKYLRNQVDRQWNLYTKITKPMQKTIDFSVLGRTGHKIPVRVYIPQLTTQVDKLPVLVYAHGGGYLFASIQALDRAVQLMANEAKVIVISIDYRLAPEYAYPVASDDGEDVFLWAKQHVTQFGGDRQRIAFGGDSAGGHIAINVAQRQLAAGKQPPKMLLLYYPATGWPFDDRSYKLFAKGYGLDASFFEYLLTKVFPGKSLKTTHPDEYMNPIQSKNLKDMPPTILATAGFDILRDSGAKFAKKLQADQVPITYLNYPSLAHSFLQFSGIIPDADKAATETSKLFGQKIRQK